MSNMEDVASKPSDTEYVHSFDVFDTCITRTFAHPRDLFHVLGHRVAPAGLNDRGIHQFASRFQQHRISAEKSAYRHAAVPQAVTITDIYTHFHPLRDLTLTASELAVAEISLERESIYPIPAIVARIEQLRATGHRIIFISDMYLPADVLGPILMNCEVMLPGDKLYVSCDVGCCKRDGGLFEYVLHSEGLNASQLVHHGDDALGDVRMARLCGIEAHHVTHGVLSVREQAIAGVRGRRQLPRPAAASFLAGFARRLRSAMIHETGESTHPLDSVIQTAIVPLLLAYVCWVLDDAKSRGLQRLYFVARDGEILLRIANTLNDGDRSPELRYLYGSRRAWLPAAIDPKTSWWRRSFAMPGQIKSAKHILSRLGLTDTDHARIRSALELNSYAYSKNLSCDESLAFIDRILRNPVTAKVVSESTDALSRVAYDYFVQEGLTERSDWALVDVGWSLNCQAAMQTILRRYLPNSKLGYGYYLARAKGCLPPDVSGPAKSFVEPPGSLFARRAAVVEYCFFPATHASTTGYQNSAQRIVPVFDDDKRNKNEQTYVDRLHKTASVASRLVREDNTLRDAIRRHSEQIIDAAEDFLRYPEREDAAMISTFDVVVDLRHENKFAKRMCNQLRASDVWHLLCDALPSSWQRSEHPIPTWVEAAAAISPWYTRWPTKALLRVGAVRDRLRNQSRPNTHD